MPVEVKLDAMLAKRAMTGKSLAADMGMSETQLSLFRSGKVRGIRFATIARMCAILQCQPGDLLSYRYDLADLGDGTPNSTPTSRTRVPTEEEVSL